MNLFFEFKGVLGRSDMLSRRCLGECLSFLTSILAGGLLLGGAQSVTAQSYQDRSEPRESYPERRAEPQPAPSSSPADVPDWAEPSEPQEGTFSENDVSPNATGPDPPDPPSRIPVDGGLALLAAAGAGYAARKLSQEEDDDEEPLP